MQFANKSNPNTHYINTAKEIVTISFPDGIDYSIVGVGTGGHISGLGSKIKEVFPDIKIIAAEPLDSPMISEGEGLPSSNIGLVLGLSHRTRTKALLMR